MKPERWKQVDELLEAALDCPASERASFLNRACAGDEELRREVESLLIADGQAEGFIERPPTRVAADLFTDDQRKPGKGDRLAHYGILEPIGAGGMGEVYLARDGKLGRQVALKLLPADFTRDEQWVRRFQQEARAASSLNHPNIVTIYEVGEEDEAHYIASEYIEGLTLRQRLASRAISVGQALDIATQVASALAAAHAAGVIHRDIKPENLMLRKDGFVKVLDFGLAKLSEQGLADRNRAIVAGASTNEPVQTSAGVVLGTVNYMSPEQARGQQVDTRTDIFSLGVVLYEMVAGRVPFEGATPSDTIAAILEKTPLPLIRYQPEVPEQVQWIVGKALRKEREERYQSANEMLSDLREVKQEFELKSNQERRAAPESNVAQTVGQPVGAGDEPAIPHTANKPSAQTDESAASTTARAEYITTVIKRHQRGVALAAAAVMVVVAALAYAYYFNPTRGGGAIDSVAVLPFVNAAGDPDTEYLSDGISDSIINSLSRLPTLKVISLNTVLRYKGKQVDPQAVGRELNVQAVLMGRMTQRGEGLAISMELVDVRDNRRLWGEQYSRKLSDILAVQDEIAREIAEKLRLRISGEEKRQLAKHHTENPEAYQLYILGRYYFRQQTKEGFEKSIGAYERAIKIDPDYALAYVGLAQVYHNMGSRGFWPTMESEQKAEWAALKALQLDDTLAEGHALMGVLKFSNFDWPGAGRESQRALELNPNSAIANNVYSYYLMNIGRVDEALQYTIRAQELDPTAEPGPGALAFAYFMARRYDQAIELYRRELEKKPDNAHVHILLGEAYVAKGMAGEGVAEMRKGMALDAALDKTPERWDRYPMLAYAYAAAGRRNEALKILDEQRRLAKQRYVSPYNFAIIYTGLGDKDQAFAWLAKCVEQRTRLIVRLKVRPMFDSLRSDPRYRDLVRRMGLEP